MNVQSVIFTPTIFSRYNMATHTYFLVLLVFLTIIIFTDANSLQTQTACYAKTFYLDECSNGKYAIHRLEFGVKSSSMNCVTNRLQENNPLCCKFSQDDCTFPMPYDKSQFLYDVISGYGIIKGKYLTVDWTSVASKCSSISTRYSHYGLLTTECIQDKNIIYMDSSKVQFGRKIYIIFQGSNKDAKSVRRNSSCVASADHGGLTVYSVDVRLQDFHTEGTLQSNKSNDRNEGICNSTHLVTLQDVDNNTLIHCRNYTIYGYNQTRFYSQGHVSITLQIDPNVERVPQMVWFAIEADDAGGTVEVNCNNGNIQTTPHTTTERHITVPAYSTAVISGATDGTMKDQDDGRHLNKWTKYIIIAATCVAVIVIIIVGLTIYFRRRNSRLRREEQARAKTRNQIRQKNKEKISSDNIPSSAHKTRHNVKPRDGESGVNDMDRRNKRHKGPHGRRSREDMEMNSPVYVDINKMKNHWAGRK